MTDKLNILFLEDNLLDAELEVAALEEFGIECVWERVDNREDFLQHIERGYDLIIADHSLPSFDGITAVSLLRQRGCDTPLILVSGTVGEEVAIDSLKAGATDYVLKDRLARLGPVVRRALREHEEQRQRREAEESLRESQRKYEDLVNSMEGIVWECNAETFEFSFVSRQAERLLGYPVDQWLASPNFWPDHLHCDDRQWVVQTCKQATLERRNHEFEYRMIAADGREVWLRDIVSVAADHGHPITARGVMIDITHRKKVEEERKQLEEQLLQAQKMESIGRLAGGVAHDFNNLLTAIIGYSQLMLARMGDEASFRREAEEIMRAGQRAASLTSQLLAFSRRQKLERKVISINDTINNVIRMLCRIIGEDIDVDVQTRAGEPVIFADLSQIEQVLLNLAVNARDAMPGGGSLMIETDNVELDDDLCRRNLWAKAGRFVRLAVSDTGTGMDQEILKRVFEPFFTTKDSGKGTGLGLSVVYGVVQQHDGLINVHSEPGRGTRFEVYFPLHGEATEKEPDEESLPARGGKETILVAEDEESLQNLTRKILSKLGYRVLMARDGAEALEIIETGGAEIDLLILDMVMPRMSGREVYLRLRAAGSDIPVIFMTGYSADMVDTVFVETVGAPFLRKPYDINQLGNHVRSALDQNRGSGGKTAKPIA